MRDSLLRFREYLDIYGTILFDGLSFYFVSFCDFEEIYFFLYENLFLFVC